MRDCAPAHLPRDLPSTWERQPVLSPGEAVAVHSVRGGGGAQLAGAEGPVWAWGQAQSFPEAPGGAMLLQLECVPTDRPGMSANAASGSFSLEKDSGFCIFRRTTLRGARTAWCRQKGCRALCPSRGQQPGERLLKEVDGRRKTGEQDVVESTPACICLNPTVY